MRPIEGRGGLQTSQPASGWRS